MDRVQRQDALSDSLIVDFYHDWMIEVQADQCDRHHYQCTSSSGVNLDSVTLYDNPLQAHQDAIEAIALFEACVALRNWLRSAFEADLVAEDEWYWLTQSLNIATGCYPPAPTDDA